LGSIVYEDEFKMKFGSLVSVILLIGRRTHCEKLGKNGQESSFLFALSRAEVADSTAGM
jgi:hypothetical protein